MATYSRLQARIVLRFRVPTLRHIQRVMFRDNTSFISLVWVAWVDVNRLFVGGKSIRIVASASSVLSCVFPLLRVFVLGAQLVPPPPPTKTYTYIFPTYIWKFRFIYLKNFVLFNILKKFRFMYLGNFILYI